MTNFRFKNFIPNIQIKINPKKLSHAIIDLINEYIVSSIYDNEKHLLKIFLVYFKSKINNYNFWYLLTEKDFCMYQFTDIKDKNTTRLCGKQIKTKYDPNDNQRMFCAEHNRKHRKINTKKIKIKENQIYCKNNNNDNSRCSYAGVIDSLSKKKLYVYT